MEHNTVLELMIADLQEKWETALKNIQVNRDQIEELTRQAETLKEISREQFKKMSILQDLHTDSKSLTIYDHLVFRLTPDTYTEQLFAKFPNLLKALKAKFGGMEFRLARKVFMEQINNNQYYLGTYTVPLVHKITESESQDTEPVMNSETKKVHDLYRQLDALSNRLKFEMGSHKTTDPAHYNRQKIVNKRIEKLIDALQQTDGEV